MTALVYEVTWHRFLSNFVGSQARASALILAVFLGGLSLGYGIFGPVSRRAAGGRLVRWCGVLELGIGVWALVFPRLYEMVWNNLGVVSPLHSAAYFVDLALAVLMIGPLTVLMGGTLPLMPRGSLDR